ncbi:6-phosphogluconate dehydrogenase [Colletotrichum acutatum]|uniref:6-phosphogluconate dehydrogenase n=1 Tax=Glomerella acutata TaxID=27357 RepID=A0AAD8UQS2_GLOAC|nr:6-phosphogluconate dehydrogenase [Colletotrichum acutatum]KAK1726169.1 6-phosphogluconate dehydrogenase [Colletotrichum acutatum]
MAATNGTPSKIGVISIGDMGVGIAKLLIAKGFQVATNCKGRSVDTLQRARDAKVELLDTDEALASQCAVILSVVPPRDAEATADRIIDALAGTPSRETPLYFIDMNAVAPSTCKSIAASFARTRTPARFVDACIIGAPPRPKSAPNAGTNVSASAPPPGTGGEDEKDDPDAWYVPGMPMSGPDKLSDLSLPGSASPDGASFGARLSSTLGGNHISDSIGAASGLKMCFASLSKGFTAIATQAFTSAHRMGVLPHLRDELAARLPAHLQSAEKGVVTMPPKAYRWVREMEEISKTHTEEGGFGPELFVGAASVYKSVAEDSPLGGEKIGKRKRGTTVEDVAAALTEGFERKKKKTD